MSKGKSITLLIIISVIIAVLAVVTFVTIPNLGEAGVYYFPSTMKRINDDVLSDDFTDGSVYVLSLNEDISDEDSGLVIKDVTDELNARLEILGYTSSNVYAVRSSENESYKIRLEIDNNSNTPLDVAVAVMTGDLVFKNADEDEVLFTGEEGVYDVYIQENAGQYYTSVVFTTAALNILYSFKDTLLVTVGDTTIMRQSDFDVSSILSAGGVLSLNAGEDLSAARRLLVEFKYGGTSYDYTLVDEESEFTSVGRLGENSALITFLSIVCAVAAIMIVLCILYRGLGLVADIAILTFVLLQMLFLVLVPGIVLSASGMIGVAIATALAVFSQVIIIERIKRESASGKTVRSAVRVAYNDLGISLLEGSILIAVGAVAAFFLTTSGVNNIAIGLGIGVVIAYLISVWFARLLTSVFGGLVKNKEGFFNLEKGEVE